MINLHKPTAAGFTAAILFIGALAMSAPASAHGPGGFNVPSAGMSAPAAHGPVPVKPDLTFVNGSTTGRAIGSSYLPVGSNCSTQIVDHRRVRVCN
jgi:hypothetical protein